MQVVTFDKGNLSKIVDSAKFTGRETIHKDFKDLWFSYHYVVAQNKLISIPIQDHSILEATGCTVSPYF